MSTSRVTSTTQSKRVFFHVDMDAFYASVEQRDNLKLVGKPVIIGASPGTRGVVSACSYEARVFGVHSAMPISEAVRKCPEGIFLPVRMGRYQEASSAVMDILSHYTPVMRQISVDEACLDMTGTERLFGPPLSAALRLKREVRDKTGLTLSIGIAPNRYLAKLASERDKPDGLWLVEEGKEVEFLDKMPLRSLWGVGKKTLARLTECNIITIKALRRYSLTVLRSMMGDGCGTFLYEACRGIDPGISPDEPKSRSISTETTFEHDVSSRETILAVLLELTHQVAFRLLSECCTSKTLFLKIRYTDFTTTSIQKTLKHYVVSAEETYAEAVRLFDERWVQGEPLRLIGMGFSSLEGAEAAGQGEFFPNLDDRRKQVEKTVLAMNQKGRQVVKARLIAE